MHILVTGGAGYIGSVSVERLLEAGHRVTVLDDLSKGHDGSVVENATFVHGSFGDRELVTRLLVDGDIEAVLHCAARSLVGESMVDPGPYYATNVVGGLALLEAMRDAGVMRMVLSSTAAVYGVPESSPIPEDAVLRPINPYGESKRTFEGAMRWYGTAYGLRSASLRYFNVAGASARNGEVHDPETHLIPNVLTAAAGGPALTLFGDDYPTPDGTPIRDYIHVVDLGDAHLAALEATAPGDSRTDSMLIANVGSGGGFSVKEVLAAAERVVGAPVPHTIGPRRAGDPPILVASIERARQVLGWEPRRSTLEQMIGSAWSWRQAHPHGIGRRPQPTEALIAAWVEPAPRLDGKIHLADYDPRWPELYAREAARIREVLGPAVVRIEHVGSTSVPGLDAKPIIDILLAVPSSADEPAYAPSLEAAGYRLVIREPDWHEHRVFKGPDTNINLHVFSPDSPEIERMVAFRDHLRANDVERDTYLAEKRRLAALDWDYVQSYADAKSAVVEAIIARAIRGKASGEG